MSISLVSITHPIDPHSEVPFVGGRAPLMNVSVETWKVRHIEAMGFGVEIHAEPYDPVAASNAKAVELAAALGQPVVAVAATPVKKAAPAAPVAPAPVPEIVAAPAAPVAPVAEELPVDEPTAVGEPEQTAGEDEEATMTEDEVLALRARVEALSTTNDAKALIAEYGIELNPMPGKLKDIKAQLIAMIDAPAE
jgi:hypothetical protein